MKKMIFTLSLFLSAGYALQAEEISVTPETFKDAYTNAEDGDVLLLGEGTYDTDMTFPSGKSITLKAAEGESPVLSGGVAAKDETISGGSMIFDGVYIKRKEGQDYFIRLEIAGDMNVIAFRNLTIDDIRRCLVRVDNANYSINNIEIDNCIIKNCGSRAWNLIYTKHIVKKVSVKNSTLYNYLGGESLFCANNDADDEGASSNVFEFLFENNTVYKWSKDSSRGLVHTAILDAEKVPAGNRYSPESTYTFRNNIVTVPGVDGVEPNMAVVFEGTVIAENNLIVNYGGYVGGTQTVNDLSLDGLGLQSIGFADPENGDFTIAESSPLNTAGKGGKPVGDPRWAKAQDSVESGQVESKDIKSETYYNLQGVMIAKENAKGLVIVKTVYVDNTESTDKRMIMK